MAGYEFILGCANRIFQLYSLPSSYDNQNQSESSQKRIRNLEMASKYIPILTIVLSGGASISCTIGFFAANALSCIGWGYWSRARVFDPPLRWFDKRRILDSLILLLAVFFDSPALSGRWSV